MKLSPITAISFNLKHSTPLKKTEENHKANYFPIENHANKVSVPSNLALAQMPNVNFGAKKDDLNAHHDYDRGTIPHVEMEKYRISEVVNEALGRDDYLTAIKGKTRIAQICKSQGKEDDAFLLEESIRSLYGEMPLSQRNSAKNIIRAYNEDMADYIDEDILK